MKLDSSSSQRSAASSEGKPCAAELAGPGRHLAVDHAGPPRRPAPRSCGSGAPARPTRSAGVLLVRETRLGEGPYDVVQPVAAAAHMVDEAGRGERGELALGLLLVRRRAAPPRRPRPGRPGRRARGGAAAGGPARTGRCSAATGPARWARPGRTPRGPRRALAASAARARTRRRAAPTAARRTTPLPVSAAFGVVGAAAPSPRRPPAAAPRRPPRPAVPPAAGAPRPGSRRAARAAWTR